MILREVKCHNCGELHKIHVNLITTSGIACKLLAYTDVEFEFTCKCGAELLVSD